MPDNRHGGCGLRLLYSPLLDRLRIVRLCLSVAALIVYMGQGADLGPGRSWSEEERMEMEM